MRVLIIDNYDSYTYNLVQMTARLTGVWPLVFKNDEKTAEELLAMEPEALILSPGPGRPDRPEDFGVCAEMIEKASCPILGVCLGEQGIWEAFGGEVARIQPVHGGIDGVFHEGEGIFAGLPNPFPATRYHSLAAVGKAPEALKVTARTKDGVIMGIQHRERPIYGVQFHPESIGTPDGETLLKNFFSLAGGPGLSWRTLPARDPLEVFYRLEAAGLNPLWLDSSRAEKGLSRFSVFGLRGKRSFTLRYEAEEQIVEIETASGEVEQYHEELFSFLSKRPKRQAEPALPCEFQLGLVGYLGYEAGFQGRHRSPWPDAMFTYCDRAVILDHEEKTLTLLAFEDDGAFLDELETLFSGPFEIPELPAHEGPLPRFSLAMGREAYLEAIESCMEAMRAGESYEICLTNCLHISEPLETADYYRILREESPGQYSALLRFPGLEIASSSMEKFMTLDRHGRVTTKPIKGTCRRGVDEAEDRALIAELSSEAKTRAENLMIVDLLRNDLGKVAAPGTVEVTKLMDVETYETLHQLVSTVECDLAPERDGLDLLRASFPGGSMTGAPKKRSCEIIDGLEPQARGVYSGAIGYLSDTGALDFSIVIRTLVVDDESSSLGIGGAIILLSDPEEEYEEILLKAKASLLSCKRYYGMDKDEEIRIED